jgi:hypothetical protein
MSQEKVFADGFSFKRNENAPDFVVGRLAIKVEDAVAFMKDHQKNGWVNISIKYGRSGNPYCELDNFEPSAMSKKGGDMLKNDGNMSKNVDSMSKNNPVNEVDLTDELPF